MANTASARIADLKPGDGYVQSFARGLEVIRSFSAKAPSQTLTEVAGRAGLSRAGARLVEVGTTNRTHLRDYAEAIDARSGVLLKVHTSNYRVEGFTAAVPTRELAALARERGLPLVVDLGSGTLIDPARFGLPQEPTVAEVIARMDYSRSVEDIARDMQGGPLPEPGGPRATHLKGGSFYNTLFMWPLLTFGWEIFLELAGGHKDELKRLMADFACLSRKVFQAAAMPFLMRSGRVSSLSWEVCAALSSLSVRFIVEYSTLLSMPSSCPVSRSIWDRMSRYRVMASTHCD